jgi:2-isopropylmalate synthase
MNVKRYRPIPPVKLTNRSWPDRALSAAPRWCSVDLRDGNQALIEPMGRDRKLRFFETLVKVGLREIEVGFPAASQTDFDFVRMLIDEGRIPENVTIQVLTQAREHLIARTIDAVRGARRAIVHVYNSVSVLQRRVVFGMDRPAIKEMAVQGTRWVKEHAKTLKDTEVILEYSPESFTGTEMEYAAEVSDAVVETWGATPERKMILNLPATVEMSAPNVYADQIEWMHKNLKHRDKVVISLHTHNDRGCAVAAAELGMLAGAERVEGTLFGNGERTGNADLVTVAMNMFSQGIDPGLDFSDLPNLVEVFEYCNHLPVPARHPYAGELVFTAFSGSHQDAIKKGLEALDREKNPYWEVPYLPIDPADVGRKYEPLVRINSQSGKGGVAFVLERTHGYAVPKGLAIEFSHAVQRITDATGEELSPSAVFEAFDREYLKGGRYVLSDFDVHREGKEACTLKAAVLDSGKRVALEATGNGPIDAFVRGVRQALGMDVRLLDYSEHALDNGENAEAVAYVQLRHADGHTTFGVGRDDDIVAASLRAVLSGLNRLSLGAAPKTRSTPP